MAQSEAGENGLMEDLVPPWWRTRLLMGVVGVMVVSFAGQRFEVFSIEVVAMTVIFDMVGMSELYRRTMISKAKSHPA